MADPRLRGIAAALDLLQTLEALPPTRENDEDDEHDDFQGADRLVSAALEKHGTDAGFRLGLTWYALTSLKCGTPVWSAWTPKKVLDDWQGKPL